MVFPRMGKDYRRRPQDAILTVANKKAQTSSSIKQIVKRRRPRRFFYAYTYDKPADAKNCA